MNRCDFLRRVGTAGQVFGSKEFRLSEGKGNGVRGIEMYNAQGMRLTVLPDRGFDIAALSCRGINIGFMSKTGITHPAYFAEDGTRGFFRSFYAGFLTTCGLTYMGAPSREGEQILGLHGLVSNIPACGVWTDCTWGGERAYITAGGKISQAQVFGENLELTRTIILDAFENRIKISDHIENLGFCRQPFMLLYHMNYGYPMLSPDCRLILPTDKIIPRDEDAAKGLGHYLQISEPEDLGKEEVFFHTMRQDNNGLVRYRFENNMLGIAVETAYNADALTHFTQWKSMISGEYALGLEPGNCHVLGREKAQLGGELKYIEAGEVVQTEIEISIQWI